MTEKDLIIQDLRRENTELRRRMPQWISVKDKVPKDSGDYLVVHRNKYNGNISTAIETYIKCKIGEWWANDYVYDVIHWMPLPLPLKGE